MGAAAKPIIDLLLAVADPADEPAHVPDLKAGRPRAGHSEVRSSSTPTPKTEVTEAIIAGAAAGAGVELLQPSRSRSQLLHGRTAASMTTEAGTVDEEDGMRRTMVVGLAVLAVLAVVGIGIAAFNAGVDEGVSRELVQRGDADQVVRVIGHGYGYGRGWGFPFGLILFPLFVIGIVLLVRGAFWRGRWGGPGWGGPGGYGYGPPGPWGGPTAFEDWHRRQHEQPRAPADPGDAPGAGGTRDTPAEPGTA